MTNREKHTCVFKNSLGKFKQYPQKKKLFHSFMTAAKLNLLSVFLLLFLRI